MGKNRKIELVVGEILNRLPSDFALVTLLREKEGTRCLPVLVGPLEAQAIAVSLYGHKLPRPGIFDLYLNTLAAFDGSLVEVDIFKVKGGIFYSPALTHIKATYVPNDKMSIDEGHYGTEFKPA